ncbi:MAG: hypothetical protein Q9170_007776 [Blastenia crenularia]
MTDRWMVFISDRHQLQELELESESVLSMEEALHQVRFLDARPTRCREDLAKACQLAFTEPILGRLQVPPEHKGPKSEAFRVMVGVLKNKLRSNVPTMSDALQRRVVEAVAAEVASSDGTPNPEQSEWQSVRLMPALLRIFTRVNLLAFVGEDEGLEFALLPSKVRS